MMPDYPKHLKEMFGERRAPKASSILKENKPSIIQFAEKLKLHAKIEEPVLYPTAILIGEYLKRFKIMTMTINLHN
jgi:hypothetical protein